jgi:Type ISP C-terminal specificity domain
MATARYADLWGPREVYLKVGQDQHFGKSKYHWLAEHDISTTEWKTADPLSPYYLFKSEEGDVKAEYEQGYKITDIFGTGNPKTDGGKNYGLGICTHNDALHIGWTETELINRVQMLASETIPDNVVLDTLPIVESPYWNTARERAKIRKSQWKEKIWTIYYRPFDWRKIYYEPDLMDIGRGGSSRHVMDHAKFCSRNLMVAKGYEVEAFQHILVADAVAVHHAATRKEGNYLFPLYLYPQPNKNALFDVDERSTAPGGRRSNLSQKFIVAMEGKLGMSFVQDGKGELREMFGPEDAFYYMYAVFHSPTYRSRYAEFLKIDFPRLPLTSNVDLFRQLCKLGERLVGLHLMEQHGTALPMYPEEGNDKVEKVEYRAVKDQPGRVYINKTQYFEGVPSEVWNFHIGGYQVCHKWLKDRKDRVLSYEDIKHYQRIVAALAETILLMEQIDEAIEDQGGWPIE